MILIVNVAEWGEAHLKQNFPCDCGQWFINAFGKNSQQYMSCRPRIGEPYPENIDGIVISGSAASTYDSDEWIRDLSQHIIQWNDQQLPILGVCFGHQLIAQVFGGVVGKNNHGWEVGTCKVELTEMGMQDPLFTNLPVTFGVMQSHQDVVTQLPPGAECLASNDTCRFQSFKLGNRIRTIQFHPEYTVDQIEFVIRPRKEKLEASGIDMNMTLKGLVSTPESRTILSNFEHYFVGHNNHT